MNICPHYHHWSDPERQLLMLIRVFGAIHRASSSLLHDLGFTHATYRD